MSDLHGLRMVSWGRDHASKRSILIVTSRGPSRIVCLTEQPTECLCALGEELHIVGISGFTVRPARLGG